MTAFKRTGQITDTSAADQAAVVRARAALADAQALLDRTSQHGSATPEGLVRLAGAVVAIASIAWPIVDRTGFAPAVLGSLGFALGACVALFAHK